MKVKLFTIILLICATVNIQAQEAPAPNGKLAMINGVELYYEESGDGIPLVLLHFFGSTSSSWGSLVPELAKENRVIAVDLPGHGNSDYMDTTKVYLHEKASVYIIGLLDHLGLDSVNVIGASSGGFIALYMNTLRPNLIKRMVVIGGQVYYSLQTRNIITECCGKGPDANSILAHGKEKASILDKQFYHFRELYGDPSFTPDILSTIRAKSLIIHGDNDDIAPVFNAWQMFNHIPGASLWIIPNGGHLPYLDPENQLLFVNKISQFLNGAFD